MKYLSLCLILVAEIGFAQIMIFRNYNIDLVSDTTRKQEWLGIAQVGLEGNNGIGSEADQLYWNVKLASVFEFYKWKNSSIAFSFFHELNVSPFNQISFQPHTALWNEMIYWQRKMPNFILETGITHRCRHSVDNDRPPRRGTKGNDTTSYRVLVFNTLYTHIHSLPVKKGKFSYRGSLRFDYHLYSEDSRRPSTPREQPDLENLRWSLLGISYADYQVKNWLKLYNRNWYQVAGAEENFQHNYRLEAGLKLLGKAYDIAVFGGYEYYFDDISWYKPVSSSVIQIGLRGLGKNFY